MRNGLMVPAFTKCALQKQPQTPSAIRNRGVGFTNSFVRSELTGRVVFIGFSLAAHVSGGTNGRKLNQGRRDGWWSARHGCELPFHLASEQKLERFLRALAGKDVASSSQNQAFYAIVYPQT